MIFSLHHGGVVMSSQITHMKSSNIHPLAHILDIWALIFSSCAIFSLPQPHLVTASHLPPGDNHQSTGGLSKKSQGTWNSFSYIICTRALHSFLSNAHYRAAFTVIPLLPKATFTPSIQPNLGLSRTRPPSAINTLLAIRYSSILSTCPNHLKALWFALVANSLSIPWNSNTHLFIPNFI